eukprot:scaffold42599_cov59-Phaeocystis_antarctica.AAC.4
MLGVSGNGGGGGRGECDSDGGGGDGGSDGGGGACRVERSGAAVRARIIFVAGPRQRVVIHDRLLAANQRRGRLAVGVTRQAVFRESVLLHLVDDPVPVRVHAPHLRLLRRRQGGCIPLDRGSGPHASCVARWAGGSEPQAPLRLSRRWSSPAACAITLPSAAKKARLSCAPES